MICLACGCDQSGAREECSACGHKFAVFPPYVRCNHVAQLQAAVREWQQGTSSLEQFAEIYGRFAELGINFQQRWRRSAEATLVASLKPALQDQFLAGVKELDMALGLLEEALLHLDQALETDARDSLTTADSLLTDFFKIGCGGCALLIEELEKSESQESRGSVLDLRGL